MKNEMVESNKDFYFVLQGISLDHKSFSFIAYIKRHDFIYINRFICKKNIKITYPTLKNYFPKAYLFITID